MPGAAFCSICVCGTELTKPCTKEVVGQLMSGTCNQWRYSPRSAAPHCARRSFKQFREGPAQHARMGPCCSSSDVKARRSLLERFVRQQAGPSIPGQRHQRGPQPQRGPQAAYSRGRGAQPGPQPALHRGGPQPAFQPGPQPALHRGGPQPAFQPGPQLGPPPLLTMITVCADAVAGSEKTTAPAKRAGRTLVIFMASNSNHTAGS